tara:strand:+ start:734 stop:1834 length:1101 start_codon:yes stop_codon:yes gene_type:complete
MAKKKKEDVAEVATEEPKVLEITSEDKIKVKKPKKKKFESNDEIIKVDLSKKPQEAEETEITKVDLTPPTIVEDSTEQPIVEITEEIQVKTPKAPELPENIQKVVEFMKDTGGDLNDYMNLNRDFESYEDDDLLRSYYKETKPHLEDDEINFLVEDSFDWNENIDDEKEVKRKKLALKEQVADAKSHLDGLKSKYYEDIKMGSKLTDEQQDAVKFFNESKERYQTQEQAQSTFLNKTEEVFNDEFKGFEYQIGDKRFRYNVGDAEKVKTTQSDINNFVGKFLNEENQMDNASGYHKSLFTAMNSDAIANHFYEQGKADALKESIAKSKNINMDPRQMHSAPVQSGVKVRVLGDNSSDFKFKIKSKK